MTNRLPIRISFDRKNPACLKENALPKVISRSDRSYAYSFGLDDIYHSSDFVRVDKKLERYDHYYKASKPGAELKFKWKGRKIGIEILMTDFSGEFSCKIDNGEPFSRSGWDEQCSAAFLIKPRFRCSIIRKSRTESILLKSD